MKWPWVSRKRLESETLRLGNEIAFENARFGTCQSALKQVQKHNETLKTAIAAVRDELATRKQGIEALTQKLTDKDTVIEAQRKEIERLEKSLPVSLNPRRKHFHGAGGIKERLETEAANEKKSTVPEGAN